MSSLVLDLHLRRRCTKFKNGLVIGIVNSHGLTWAKWTSTIVVFHKRGHSLMVLPFSCFSWLFHPFLLGNSTFFLKIYSQTWNFLELSWTQRVWGRHDRKRQHKCKSWRKGGWERRNIDSTSFCETNVFNIPWGAGFQFFLKGSDI